MKYAHSLTKHRVQISLMEIWKHPKFNLDFTRKRTPFVSQQLVKLVSQVDQIHAWKAQLIVEKILFAFQLAMKLMRCLYLALIFILN